MTSGLTIVGKRDAKLEELVRASGQVTTVTWLTDLSTLVDAKAAQPDVLLVDVRQRGGVPPQLATLKRQHPATNVVLLAATLDPTVMLEGMRAGVNECIAEPLRQDDVNAALARLLGHQAKEPAGPCLPSSAPRAVSERPRRRSTSRPPSRSCRRGTPSDGSAPCLWRCRGVPRRRRALLGARCPREPAPARRAVSEESRLPHGVEARTCSRPPTVRRRGCSTCGALAP